MRVTLIHNAKAGDQDSSRDELVNSIRSAGHEVSYFSTKDDWNTALREPTELVVVAGGDGTVARVAKALVAVDGTRPPMAIIRCGTANNIANSLGVSDAKPAEQAAGWATASRQPFDVGRVVGPWGEKLFVESVGCGLFADMMVEFERKQKKNPTEGTATDELYDARAEMRRVLDESHPKLWHVELDGEDMAGHYLLVEVMNIRQIGPGIILAPEADAGDGWLHVVFVCDEDADRGRLNAHLHEPPSPDAKPPNLTVRRAKSVVLHPFSDQAHVDDEAIHGPNAMGPGLSVTLDAGTLTVLI